MQNPGATGSAVGRSAKRKANAETRRYAYVAVESGSGTHMTACIDITVISVLYFKSTCQEIDECPWFRQKYRFIVLNSLKRDQYKIDSFLNSLISTFHNNRNA